MTGTRTGCRMLRFCGPSLSCFIGGYQIGLELRQNYTSLSTFTSHSQPDQNCLYVGTAKLFGPVTYLLHTKHNMYLRHNFGVSGRFSTDFIFTQKSWDTSETHFNIQKMKFLETKCYRFFADIQTCYKKTPQKNIFILIENWEFFQ